MADEQLQQSAEERIAALERQVAEMRDVLTIVIRRAQTASNLTSAELKRVNDFVRAVGEWQVD